MSAREPRFEVVHTGPRQFHARFRAANGEIVWTTETYRRRRTARTAIALLIAACGWDPEPDLAAYLIREVDER